MILIHYFKSCHIANIIGRKTQNVTFYKYRAGNVILCTVASVKQLISNYED